MSGYFTPPTLSCMTHALLHLRVQKPLKERSHRVNIKGLIEIVSEWCQDDEKKVSCPESNRPPGRKTGELRRVFRKIG